MTHATQGRAIRNNSKWASQARAGRLLAKSRVRSVVIKCQVKQAKSVSPHTWTSDHSLYHLAVVKEDGKLKRSIVPLGKTVAINGALARVVPTGLCS